MEDVLSPAAAWKYLISPWNLVISKMIFGEKIVSNY